MAKAVKKVVKRRRERKTIEKGRRAYPLVL